MLNIKELEARTYGHNRDNQWMYANARENFPKTFEQNLTLFSNYDDVIKKSFSRDAYSLKLIRNIEINEFLHRGENQSFREFLENDSEVFEACSELHYKIYSQISKVIYQMCHKLDVFKSIIHGPWHALPEIREIKEDILDLTRENLRNFILNFETDYSTVYSGGEYFDHYRDYKAFLKSLDTYSEFSSYEKLYSLLFSKLFMSNESFNCDKRNNINYNGDFNFEKFINPFIKKVCSSNVFTKIIVTKILNDEDFNKNFSIIEKVVTICIISSKRFEYSSRLDQKVESLNVILESMNNGELTPSDLAVFSIRDFKEYFDHKKLSIRSATDVELLKDSSHPIEWIYSALDTNEGDYDSIYSSEVTNFLEFLKNFIR